VRASHHGGPGGCSGDHGAQTGDDTGNVVMFAGGVQFRAAGEAVPRVEGWSGGSLARGTN
jgi:hypothetical protein